MELITDRTESDVLLGNEKGRYTYADLNRVENAVAELVELSGLLGIHTAVSVKTDWKSTAVFASGAWPTESQMRRYLQNIVDLCDALSVSHTLLPRSMECLTWQEANTLEKALLEVYQRIKNIIQIFKYSGEFFAGEEILL